MLKAEYQLIIIGSGPAGLTAGLYAARGRLKALLIEKGASGGQVLVTDWIDNYPGFVDGVTGFDLIENLNNHADRFGLKRKVAQVSSLDLTGEVKSIVLENGEILTTETVILSLGARANMLGIPGEKKFAGKGVSYCATCDGPFYRNQHIAVVGGGNTAIQDALHLTMFADKVTVVHRGEELRATTILQEKAFCNNKIEFIWNTEVSEIRGSSNGVEELVLRHRDSSQSTLNVSGIFIFIGILPNNDILDLTLLDTDKAGFVLTNTEMETNLPGVYVAGDLRSKHSRQIINAAGEGAVAELSAERFLGNREPEYPLNCE